MAYNSIHNITQKTQGHQVVTPGGAIVPQKKTSYAHAYTFAGPQPHAPTQIGDYKYFYDKNGNQTGWDDLKSGQKRVITWDEENRIQAIADNGHTTEFKYNDAGERVIKRGEQGETAYVNQFWTVRNRSVGTKHVFVGETRVSSKVIPGDDHVNPGNDKWAGVLGQWWLHRSAQGWANGKNTVKNPHYAGNAMPDNLPEDNFVFFYHPDHLGSTEYVTDYTGELYEHVQYFAFGETWVSEHKNTETLPYLFTSKELDEEIGLYYFGARYYDPRTSVWQSADPALDEYLGADRDAEGVFEPPNLALYGYAMQNPVRLVDPDGRQVRPPPRPPVRLVPRSPRVRTGGMPGGGGSGLRPPPPRPLRFVDAAPRPLPKRADGGAQSFVTVSNGRYWVHPRGSTPPERDVVGDRLAEIVTQVRAEFNPGRHLDFSTQVEISYYRLTGQGGRAQSVLSREAGRWIEAETVARALVDPVASRAVDIRNQRPGPDMRRSEHSRVRYEITSSASVSAHASRPGISGSSETTRIIPYRAVRMDD